MVENSPRQIDRRIIDALNHNHIVRYVKNARNQAVDLSFRVRGRSEADRLIEALARAPDKNVCFAVAFNVPWAVEALISAWRRFSPGMTLVIANNSSDTTKRRSIEFVCQHYGTPHVHLPWNPEWHPCRSHGIAMNWVFFNIVTRLRPEIFGFIDHDCFPIAPYNLVDRMEGLDIFGVKRESVKLTGVWNLWAGFCFFRLTSIAPSRVDFKHRVELGLDTGGGNWSGIYQPSDSIRVAWADERIVDQNVEAQNNLHVMIADAFAHVGGASFKRGSQRHIADCVWNMYLGGVENRTVNWF